jgi:heme exporter protein CcmD
MDLIPDFGKYGFTVWACYGASICVLLGLTIHTFAENSKREK